MLAQKLYDLREKYEFCSGSDLHEFFSDLLGDPSPSGKTKLSRIQEEQVWNFIQDSFAAIGCNSPSMTEWTKQSMAEISKSL